MLYGRIYNLRAYSHFCCTGYKEQDCHFAGAKYPLFPARHTNLEVDLEHSGWTKQLSEAGFDPSVPTVWVLEGLVMYLSEEAVTTLLKELRSVSAPGSTVLIMVRPRV